MDGKTTKKSQTPLVVWILPGVRFSPGYEQVLRDQGHTLYYWYDGTETEFIALPSRPDVVLGGQCYNVDGLVDEKAFGVLTKSARGLKRAEKKREKEEARRLKRA